MFRSWLIVFYALGLPFYFFCGAQGFPVDKTSIKSLTITTASKTNGTAFIALNERFQCDFDDLDTTDENTYNYRLQHCDKNWQPSEVAPSLFIEGFAGAMITDQRDSFGTLQPYTHYHFQIPNAQTKIIASGNYLLEILDDTEKVCATRRIVIFEDIAKVSGQIVRDRVVTFSTEKQVLHFTVRYPSHLANIFQNSSVTILQNEDWNFVKKQPSPTFISGKEAIYRYNDESSFWGNNEFYFFDSKNLNLSGNNIYDTRIINGRHRTILYPSLFRSGIFYGNNPDINGKFLIRTLQGGDKNIDADYTTVYFYFENNKQFPPDTSLYIYGAFNNYACTAQNRLFYNKQTHFWETQILLKQGFYNYTVAHKTAQKIYLKTANGSFFQTENTYQVVVYYRSFESFLDRVIGVGNILRN